jgi:hypothetical protein
MTIGEFIGIWIAAGLTLMMFSFIYRDNVFFKFGEHLYLGISVGYFINIQYWQVLIPDVYRMLTIQHKFSVLVPAILGVFILLRLIPSLGWLSRMSFALYIGGFAGLAVPNVIHSILLPQLKETLRPFDVGGLEVLAIMALMGLAAYLMVRAIGQGDWVSGVGVLVLSVVIVVATHFGLGSSMVNNQLIILIAVFTVLIFFFFSLEHKGAVGGVSRIGLFFIMVSFGASFGYTVMARVSLLIGRFQFLIDEWYIRAIKGLFS